MWVRFTEMQSHREVLGACGGAAWMCEVPEPTSTSDSPGETTPEMEHLCPALTA